MNGPYNVFSLKSSIDFFQGENVVLSSIRWCYPRPSTFGAKYTWPVSPTMLVHVTNSGEFSKKIVRYKTLNLFCEIAMCHKFRYVLKKLARRIAMIFSVKSQCVTNSGKFLKNWRVKWL